MRPPKRLHPRRLVGWLAVFAGLAALIVAVCGPPGFPDKDRETADPAAVKVASSAPPPSSTTPSTTERTQRQELSSPSNGRFTPPVEAARRVSPSVVSVNVIRRERVAPRSLFEEFLVPYGYEREVAGLGSGFAIAQSGYVLTNAHVVQGATEIVLTTSDGADYPAEKIGLDELSDLALLKVEAEIPVPEFGDSDDLVIGEPAIAIGNPFGYLLSNVAPTVTTGVISGVGRHILPAAFGGSSAQQEQTIYADMIQTDASINPGNSGGPLVNADGQVIGVNSAIFSRSGGSQGLGFAIPINRALRIANQLRTLRRVRRPWVGIDVGPTERGLRGHRRGASIVRVAPDSPADRADLAPGMLLIAAQGRPLKSPLDWEAELFDVAPGESLTITVRDRRGRERQLTLSVEDVPSVRAARVEVLEGLELITLTPAIRAEQGLRSSEGAVIVNVSETVSQVTGLRRGDLITHINRWPVEDADDVVRILKYLAGRNAVQVFYERDGVVWRTTFRIVEEA